MKTRTITERTTDESTPSILSISPIKEDHGVLKQIVRQFRSKDKPKLLTSLTLEWAMELLRRNKVSVAIAERDLAETQT